MTHSPHVVVKMTTDEGIVGFGEASTWHVVYGYDQHELVWVIDRYLGPAVKGMDVTDLEAILRKDGRRSSQEPEWPRPALRSPVRTQEPKPWEPLFPA